MNGVEVTGQRSMDVVIDADVVVIGSGRAIRRPGGERAKLRRRAAAALVQTA
ncbi:hypothetical protein [Streptomyces sp. MS2.AVA.5]|uniref:Uncharacterized protein n=1 Tax=Streptomyces achmelvichensis TaxID=3134111 RepID=A0ACC6PMN6_9ACTN